MKVRRILLKIYQGLGSRSLLNWIPDKIFITIKWYLVYGKKINLKNPKEFSEKLQWMKVNERNEILSKVVDKIEVRDYIKNVLGEDVLIPKLWSGEKAENIPYDKLPEKFVIKCTHGSHCNVICKDKSKLNQETTNKTISKWLKRNWFWYGREWPYKNVKPRILIEKYMDNSGEDIKDYKFFCFNGKVEFCQVINDRFSNESMDFFDSDWNKINIQRVKNDGSLYSNASEECIKPNCYNEMVLIAEKLSEKFKFVRIDLYDINGTPYFGEITFYPADGYCLFYPNEYNMYLGDRISLINGNK